MPTCPPACRAFVARHRRRIRRSTGLALLWLFFYTLGQYADPVMQSAGMCSIYP